MFADCESVPAGSWDREAGCWLQLVICCVCLVTRHRLSANASSSTAPSMIVEDVGRCVREGAVGMVEGNAEGTGILWLKDAGGVAGSCSDCDVCVTAHPGREARRGVVP